MPANKMIYLDNAATTKPYPEVLDLFVQDNESLFANSNSPHRAGQDAAKALRKAKEEILSLLGLSSSAYSVLLCSGATEANNLALKGVAFQYASRGRKIISDLGEHSSVKSPLKQLKETFGYDVTMLPIKEDGKVDPKSLEEAIDKQTILVSIMGVNNEVGSINDIASLAKIVHSYPKAFLHVDATQAIGKVDLPYDQADLISFSAHKFGGLKGNGCLICKKTMKLFPQNAGGSQEDGLRSGTVDVPGALGMALALKKTVQSQKEHLEKAKALKEHLIQGLKKTNEVVFNSPEDAIPTLLNFSLLHKKASVVVEALSEKGIYVSSHSACDEKLDHGSPVLLAMGKKEELAKNAIRISFSSRTTIEEIDGFLAAFIAIIQEVRDR